MDERERERIRQIARAIAKARDPGDQPDPVDDEAGERAEKASVLTTPEIKDPGGTPSEESGAGESSPTAAPRALARIRLRRIVKSECGTPAAIVGPAFPPKGSR